jgi:hypothetical protein
MHWTERRAAKANLGQALARLDWKLYGWTEDQSDSMTDYYAPAHWDGIAAKGEFIVVVDGYAGMVERLSGTDIVKRTPVYGQECTRCEGSGFDPTDWTLEDAREDPLTYHKETVANGAIALMPDVVSPIPFKTGPDGVSRRACIQPGCHDGKLFTEMQEEIIGKWPVFQANPARRLWHVERKGVILGSGIGLKACDQDAEPLAAKIDRYTQKRTPAAGGNGAGAGGPAVWRINEEMDGVEIQFQGKPSDAIRDRLKDPAFRWRWSRRNKVWYRKDSPATRVSADEIVKAHEAEQS